MECSTEQTFINGQGKDSAVLNIAGPNIPGGMDYNPMKIQIQDEENMIILNEFLTPKQQPSSVMELSTLTCMEPLTVFNTAESIAVDYEITLNYDLIDPAIGDLTNQPINQDEIEFVSLGNDVLELSNLGHDFNMDPEVECVSPPIICFPSTDNIPHVKEGIQEVKWVPEEVLQNNPEQQGDVASTQEPQPVPRKRGRKPKGEPGAPRRRNRPKKVKLYEMNQFENSKEERRRLNAINAKRHRCMAKDKMSKFENLLAAVTKERDLLKKEVEKLQRNEESLLMKLRVNRVVPVN